MNEEPLCSLALGLFHHHNRGSKSLGQIARVARREPDAYASCERISLVSSFVTSLFAGHYCSIDASDASGMNLMDIRFVLGAAFMPACELLRQDVPDDEERAVPSGSHLLLLLSDNCIITGRRCG